MEHVTTHAANDVRKEVLPTLNTTNILKTSKPCFKAYSAMKGRLT
jgi:hypothetical protein